MSKVIARITFPHFDKKAFEKGLRSPHVIFLNPDATPDMDKWCDAYVVNANE